MYSNNLDKDKKSFSIQDILGSTLTSSSSYENKRERNTPNNSEIVHESWSSWQLSSSPAGPSKRTKFDDLRTSIGGEETEAKKWYVNGIEGETEITEDISPTMEQKESGPLCETTLNDSKRENMYTDNKPKKTRTVFSRRQIYQLETAFDLRRYLSSSERSFLAQNLDLTETQIKIWFQNRRNKWKRQMQNSINSYTVNQSLSCMKYPAPMQFSSYTQERMIPSCSSPCCHNFPTQNVHPLPFLQNHCEHYKHRCSQISCVSRPVFDHGLCTESDYMKAVYHL